MSETNPEFTNTNNPQKFSFTGKGGEFIFLLFKNLFLTIITIGIYWFWAKVETTKFLYKNTRFQGYSFDYHATGIEKLMGFLKAVGILIGVGIVNGLVAWILGSIIGDAIARVLMGVVFYLVLFIAIPIIILGALRFRLSRTSFNGIRFQFLGNPKEFTILFLKSVGLTTITLGFYAPWAITAITTYITQNSIYGNHAFDLRVKAEELLFILLKGILFSFVTFGIYSFWFRANLHNFFWNNYYFQNGKTSSDLTGGKLLITALKSVGLLFISFGIALPWVILMNRKVLVESLSFSTSVDFDSIADMPIKPGSATIENLGGDALDSFGSIAG